ncbi:MAG TPA: thioredoxin domain-containing protein [Anaerolineales bacterium]|nr:thioredoxin domain-containing protein [Anaerolineales bacterium]
MTDEIPYLPIQEVQAEPAEITITLRRIHLYAVLLPLTFVLGIGLGYLVWGRAPIASASKAAANDVPQATTASSNPQAQSAAQDTAQDASTKVTRYEVPVDDDPSLGPEEAAITFIEFSDYECPYCRKWYTEVFSRLMATYPDQVRFVFRDFPLTSIHANAAPAANAANCAGEQGNYWDFHNKLFGMELGLSKDAYLQYASQLGLDVKTFKECVESERYKEEVQADFDYAANLGVRSTPTFFINGIAVVGAQPFEVFQQVIDKELAGEIP